MTSQLHLSSNSDSICRKLLLQWKEKYSTIFKVYMNIQCVWNKERLCLDWYASGWQNPGLESRDWKNSISFPDGLGVWLFIYYTPLKISQDIFHVTLFTPIKTNKKLEALWLVVILYI